MKRSIDDNSRPCWRFGMVWLVIGGPAVVVAASFVTLGLAIANPDPALWGLPEPPDLQSQLFDEVELHVPVPTPFPLALQRRFRNRKYAQLDTIEWLDHPGAELVFIGTGDPPRLYPQ